MNPYPIIDGHNDTVKEIHDPQPGRERSFFTQSEYGHIDLPRARAGGLAGGFFALYTPTPNLATLLNIDPNCIDPCADMPLSPPIDFDYAHAYTQGMMETLFAIESQSAGQFKIVRAVNELETCLQNDVMAAIFHIEGAEAIAPDLSNLADFYERGLRSLGLVWSRPNVFGTGVPFRFPCSPDVGPGLTPAGKELVLACNELGILIDLSHLNEKGFWDVANLSAAPLVATHAGVHALCPSARNLTDAQIEAIGQSGGLIGINFHVSFLRSDGRRDTNTPLSDIVRHIDYVVERIGLDHVAFGSDFDGATMPAELGDVAGLPKLISALQNAGYDEAALNKITHQNWLRVLRKTWKPA